MIDSYTFNKLAHILTHQGEDLKALNSFKWLQFVIVAKTLLDYESTTSVASFNDIVLTTYKNIIG